MGVRVLARLAVSMAFTMSYIVLYMYVTVTSSTDSVKTMIHQRGRQQAHVCSKWNTLV